MFKKIAFAFICLGWVCLMGLAAGCDPVQQGATAEEAVPIVLTKGQQAVLAGGNDFAFDLLRACYAENGGGNLFLSPMGVSIVCSMLANGAAGQTYEEIVAAIGQKGLSLKEVNSCYQTLVTALVKADPGVKLSLANSVWTGPGLTLKKQFSEQMKTVFDAESFQVDFAAPGTLDKVNGWCSAKTSGLIPKMFEDLDPQIRVLLINALYFKGSWVYAFPKDDTAENLFQTISGQTVKQQMMNLTAKLQGYQDEKVTMVKMPYGNGAFLMEAIVPNSDFKSFLANLSPAQLQQWERPDSLQVYLSFPRFTAEFDTEEMLKPILYGMGMRQAFTEAADFSNMSGEPLYVSEFRQKTYVSVDEEGTKAAAVTEASLRKNAMGDSPTTMLFNRPFVYLIRESSTGAILFIGTKVQ